MTYQPNIQFAVVINALKRGPATAAALADELHCHISRIGYMLERLLRPGCGVVYIGTLYSCEATGVNVRAGSQNGMHMRRGRRKVYALEGTPTVPAVSPVRERPPKVYRDRELDDPDVRLRRPRSKSGSGVIAGRMQIRGYRW